MSRALHGSSVVVATLIGVGLGGGGRARAEQKADRGAVALADRGLDADADASATVTSRVDASAGAPSWPWPELGWPSSTRSALTRGATEVFAAARGRGGQLGEVAPGIRLQVTDVVDSGGRCGAWLQIAPRGWVCAADVTPSTGAPLPTERTRAVGRSLIGAYADVRAGGADAFADEAAVRAAAPRDRLSPEDFVVLRASVDIDGRAYFRTDLGLVAAERVTRREASSFAGVDLRATPVPSWPFGWASPHDDTLPLVVRDRPAPDGAVVETLANQAIIPILGRHGDYVQVGEGQWLDARDARIAETSPPPAGLRPGEKWLDVDLDQQVLVAYEGTTPVFATLVSTAAKRFITPTGVFRIGDKDTKRRMRNGETSQAAWDIADVPFVMGFRKMYALHGAYWHDAFGRPRSHGCVNLSPADAQRLFAWTEPHAPAGWIYVEDRGGGTPLRIRSWKVPRPWWRNFDGKYLYPSDPDDPRSAAAVAGEASR